MAEYDPPIYDVSVFNPAYFFNEDGITEAYLSANYLKFPLGQGLETLPDLRINNPQIHLGHIYFNWRRECSNRKCCYMWWR
jgi:hypothetical protein